MLHFLMLASAASSSAAGKDRIRFTVAPTGDRKLTLQDFTAPIDAVVLWGDGTRDALTKNAPLSHTYADEKPRTVTISGQLGGFWNRGYRTYADGRGFVTSLDEISSQSLVTLNTTFNECPSLATLPGVLNAPNLKNFDYAFYACRSLKGELPAYWLTHPNASHTRTFLGCITTMWSRYHGLGCPNTPTTATTTIYAHRVSMGDSTIRKSCGYRKTNFTCDPIKRCSGSYCKGYVETFGAVYCKKNATAGGGSSCPLDRDDCFIPLQTTASYAEAQKAGWA